MAKKKVPTVRSYDEPDIAFQRKDGSTVKIFVLAEWESIPTLLSTKYDHRYQGPSVVIEDLDARSNTRKCDEHYVNNPQTWQWISLILRDGIESMGRGTKVISKCQLTSEERFGRPKKETPEEFRNGAMKEAAFALETIAHLQGKERELLPIADKLRVAAGGCSKCGGELPGDGSQTCTDCSAVV